MSQATLLIRADANVAIGTGHVMRCLALAQAWQDTGERAVFAVAEIPVVLKQRLLAEGFEVVCIRETPAGIDDARASLELARNLRASWLVVDGDRFEVDFLQHLRSSATRILLIDDFAKRASFPADLILNPNTGASEDWYKNRSSTDALLLGESYALLRREFTSWRGARNFSPNRCRILVTFGGSDPENLSPRIVESLAVTPDYEIKMIAGPGYSHSGGMPKSGFSNVQVEFNSSNMRVEMQNADLAIIAAGGTLWELLYMRCVVLSYSRNPIHARVVEELQKKGAVRNMGLTSAFDGSRLLAAVGELAQSHELRRQLATIGKRLVDGGGAMRVAQHLGSCG